MNCEPRVVVEAGEPGFLLTTGHAYFDALWIFLNPFLDMLCDFPLLYVGVTELISAVNKETEPELRCRVADKLKEGFRDLGVRYLLSTSSLRLVKQMVCYTDKLVREK